MLPNPLSEWQARLTPSPCNIEWMQQNEQELEEAEMAALVAEDEVRRYPYGRPEHDTGWYWEKPN